MWPRTVTRGHWVLAMYQVPRGGPQWADGGHRVAQSREDQSWPRRRCGQEVVSVQMKGITGEGH